MNWFNKLIKLAIQKKMWHGTSSENIRSILKNGLIIPTDEKKVYPSDNPAASFPGVYLSSDINIALGAASAATVSIKFGGVIALIEVITETKTGVIDEDLMFSFYGAFERAFYDQLKLSSKDHGFSSFLASAKFDQFLTSAVSDSAKFNALVNAIINDIITQLSSHQGIKESHSYHHGMIIRRVIQAARSIIIGVLRKVENEMRYPSNKEKPAGSIFFEHATDAVIAKDYRQQVEAILKALKTAARESTNIRVPDSIGFSGSNRIISIYAIDHTGKFSEQSIEPFYTTPESTSIGQLFWLISSNPNNDSYLEKEDYGDDDEYIPEPLQPYNPVNNSNLLKLYPGVKKSDPGAAATSA